MSLTYTFTPPTVSEGPAGTDWLFMRYKLTRGITVLKKNGQYIQTRYPTQDDVAAADVAYIGGYLYFIDDTEAAALTAAGYTVTAVDTTPPAPPALAGVFGAGQFGAGIFGGF